MKRKDLEVGKLYYLKTSYGIELGRLVDPKPGPTSSRSYRSGNMDTEMQTVFLSRHQRTPAKDLRWRTERVVLGQIQRETASQDLETVVQGHYAAWDEADASRARRLAEDQARVDAAMARLTGLAASQGLKVSEHGAKLGTVTHNLHRWSDGSGSQGHNPVICLTLDDFERIAERTV